MGTKNISIRVSEEQYTIIANLAKKQNRSITELILHLTGALPTDTLLISDVIARIENQDIGSKFRVRDLYSPDVWTLFESTLKRSVGRSLILMLRNNKLNLQSLICELPKDSSNAQWYERIERG